MPTKIHAIVSNLDASIFTAKIYPSLHASSATATPDFTDSTMRGK